MLVRALDNSENVILVYVFHLNDEAQRFYKKFVILCGLCVLCISALIKFSFSL